MSPHIPYRHGYLRCSGLPDEFSDYVLYVTGEGENYLLTQQTTRYLLRVLDQARQGTVVSGMADYVNDIGVLSLSLSACLSSSVCQSLYISTYHDIRSYWSIHLCFSLRV